MNSTKLLKAGLGAGLLLVLGAGYSFASPAANNVAITVTADTGTITLQSSCVVAGEQTCATAFDLDATLTRGDSDVALDNADAFTQTLSYVTDYSSDEVQVTAGGASAATELNADSITLKVTAGDPSAARAGENTGSSKGQKALTTTDATSLIDGINGTEAQVQATSLLSFKVDAGVNADIGTSNFTLTYTLIR